MRLSFEEQEALALSSASTKYYAKLFLPEFFYRPFASITDQIFDAIDDPTKQKVVIAAPRGWGKTSTIGLALPARHITFDSKKYIVYISASADAAIEQTENLKNELIANEMINYYFGELDSQNWSQQKWLTQRGTKVIPRGAGQQVRGRRHKQYRPDLIIVDDIEDDEHVDSEEQRRKLKQWFFSSVVNSVDKGSKDYKIIVIGTVLHEDSLLVNLLNDKDWFKIRIELCDDNCNSYWPDYMTTEAIKAEKDAYAARGELSIFYREFRNIPVAKELTGFKPEYFKYYEESEEELNRNKRIESVVLADPAKTHKTGSANTAVLGVSFDFLTGKVYVRDVVERQMFPDELYAEMFAMADRIKAHILAPEVTSLNEYITYPLMNAMKLARRYFEVVEIQPRDNKASRAAALIPLYRQGLVYHNKNACGALETYLMSYPRPAKWDIIDCLSGITFVLEKGERYFSIGGVDYEDDIEKEYEALKQFNEPALTGWERI